MNEYKPFSPMASCLVYIYDSTDYYLLDGHSTVPQLLSVVYHSTDIMSREVLVQRLNDLGDYYAGKTEVIPEFSGLYWCINGTNYPVASAESIETLAALEAQYHAVSEEEFRKIYSDALYFAAIMCDDSESYTVSGSGETPLDPGQIPAGNQASYNELKAAMTKAEENEFNFAAVPLAKSVSINNVQVIGEA